MLDVLDPFAIIQVPILVLIKSLVSVIVPELPIELISVEEDHLTLNLLIVSPFSFEHCPL